MPEFGFNCSSRKNKVAFLQKYLLFPHLSHISSFLWLQKWFCSILMCFTNDSIVKYLASLIIS